jgi:hypothetical protein
MFYTIFMFVEILIIPLIFVDVWSSNVTYADQLENYPVHYHEFHNLRIAQRQRVIKITVVCQLFHIEFSHNG